MTPEEHVTKLARIEELMVLDPALDSPEGIELNALADEVHAYELEHFPLAPFPELK